MRKVSAHYYLKPDGTFGKRPVVEIDDNGIILNVRELGDDFKEEPGLEYFPGLLIPAFVAAINPNDTNYRQKISMAKINGVLRIAEVVSEVGADNYINAWAGIKKHYEEEKDDFSLSQNIIRHTFIAAESLRKEKEWGCISKGCAPGLLLIQNFDMKRFTLTPDSKFKIIEK